MKIDAGTSYQYSQRREPILDAANSAAAAFSSALAASKVEAAAQAGGAGRPDFTNMTRQEMRDWVNGQIRSGKLSLDDGMPFMAMTMKIPVGGDAGLDISAAGDSERIDFVQKARNGIEGALSRNDRAELEMLQSALAIMRVVR